MKKITLKLAVLSAFIFGTGLVSAQDNSQKCSTVAYNELKNSLSANSATESQFENWLSSKINVTNLTTGVENVKFTLPVVFHIIHNNTDALGVESNVSGARVMSQIRVLNEDFSNTGSFGGANSTGLSVDTGIQFALAKRKPDGSATTGIERYSVDPNKFPSSDPNILTTIDNYKATIAWDTTKYLNIYVYARNYGSVTVPDATSFAAGHAYFPLMSTLKGIDVFNSPSDDGVVIDYRALGSDDDSPSGTPWHFARGSINKGRTATHELGHWLGLRHINGDSKSCSSDDYVADTPYQNTLTEGNATNVCTDFLNKDTCSANAGKDLYQNYMDYTPDSCMDNFTQGQKDRMVTVLLNSPRRKELVSSNAADAPSVPIIKFTTAPQVIEEPTGCTTAQNVLVQVQISEAPANDAILSISSSGDLASGKDFQVVSSGITFSAGSTTPKSFLVRVFDNASIGSDTIKLDLTLTNPSATNAILTTSESKSLYIAINDNDNAQTTTTTVDVFKEDFESYTKNTFLPTVNSGQTNGWRWLNAAGSRAPLIWNPTDGGFDTFENYDGNCMISVTNGEGVFGGSYGTLEMQKDYMVSKEFTIPANATKVLFNAKIGVMSRASTTSARETVFVSFSSTFDETDGINGSEVTPGGDRELVARIFQTGDTGVAPIFEADMSQFAGQTGRLVIYHTSNTGSNGILLVDHLDVTAEVPTNINSSVVTATPVENPLKASGILNSEDAVTKDFIVSINNTGAKDYGCVTTSISRAGTGGTSNLAGDPTLVMDKTVTVTPTINAVGNAIVNFYVSTAELTGWETASGKSRNDLLVQRKGNTAESVPATVTAFGNGFMISGNVTGGIQGVYSFGATESLSTSEFAFDVFTVYPNPTSDSVTINLSTQTDVNVSLFDIRGREVLSDTFNNSSTQFSKTIDVSALNTGIYVLKVESNGNKAIKKLVIK